MNTKLDFASRAIAAFGVLFIVSNVMAERPRWEAKTEQVFSLGAKQQGMATSCSSTRIATPVITAESSQNPKNVVIKFLQRPLDADKKGVLQSQTKGTASHVQIVVEDKETGKIYENFGLTGSFMKEKKAKIFSEKTLAKYDKENPLGVVEMSFDDYVRSRDRTKSQAEDSYYVPLNEVDPIPQVVAGAALGYVFGGVRNMLYGGKLGLSMAFNAYDKDSRRNYKILEEDTSKMCFAGFNCQSLVDLFLANARSSSSFKEIRQYQQPGESRSDDDAFNALHDDGSGIEVATSLLGGGTIDEASNDANQQTAEQSSSLNNADNRKDDIERQIAASIDTSKLESLIKEQIQLCELILDKGKAYDEDYVKHNKINKKIVSEFKSICMQVEEQTKTLNLTDKELEQILPSLMEKLSREGELAELGEKLEQLHQLIESRHLIDRIEKHDLSKTLGF